MLIERFRSDRVEKFLTVYLYCRFRHVYLGEINVNQLIKISTCQDLRGMHCMSRKSHIWQMTHQNRINH